jgi:hypothetical protein
MPYSRVLLERLAGCHLVEKFPPFLWNPMVRFRFYKPPPHLSPIISRISHYLCHIAESFLRSQQVVTYSRNSPHFMEPDGSLPLLQEPPTCSLL